MSQVCSRCGKKTDDEGFSFCPYCGGRLSVPANAPAVHDRNAEKWLRKARAETAYPKRKKILQKGLEECPGNRELCWEMLFIGEGEPGKRNAVDFSVIKSHALDMYHDPAFYTPEEQERMRLQLFGGPGLEECFALFEDPAEKQREYIQRLCREYVSVFLAGDNRIMGSLFGIRTEKNREMKLAGPVKQMIGRVGKDCRLLPEQQLLLREGLVLAYCAETGGKAENLDTLP